MHKADGEFAKRVCAVVADIPMGQVMTYGQIAGICGNARAARIVGGIAHYGDAKLPWQRVVNKRGGLAAGYPGGRLAHKQELEAEGVKFIKKDGENYVDLTLHLLNPTILNI